MKKSELRQIIKEEISNMLNLEINGEILSSGDVELAIVKSKDNDVYHIVAVDKKDDSIEAIDRRELSQMEICRMERREIERRFNTLTRDLFENRVNEDFGVEFEIIGRGNNLMDFCSLN